MLKHKFKKAYDKIKNGKNFLVVCHDRSDGDALSSVGAIIELLESMDKKYTAFSADTPPHQFHFLPHVDKIVSEKGAFSFDKFDTIIVVDCGSLSRTNLVKEIKGRRKNQTVIEFDHHPRIDNFADISIKSTKAVSTTEVLYHLFKINKLPISKNTANCILTGILTDTGNFLYPITSDKAIKISSEMLVYGARYPEILENTWRNKSLGAMKLWGIAMSNLKINKNYNLAYTILTNKQIEESGSSEEELEGISGFLSNISEADALLFLRELDDGTIRGSLRGMHPNVDISILAQFFGGGGHQKSSGFGITGKLQETSGGWQLA